MIGTNQDMMISLYGRCELSGYCYYFLSRADFCSQKIKMIILLNIKKVNVYFISSFW